VIINNPDDVKLMGCLHDPANVQQSSSKCIQNTRELLDVCWKFAKSLLEVCWTFAGNLLEVYWTFAGRLLDRVNTPSTLPKFS